MLDFGWSELLIIVAVAVFVIGPAELPALMIGLGRLFKRFQYMKFALTRQFEDIMHDAGLDDLSDQVNFEASNKSDKSDKSDLVDPEYMESIDPADAHKQALSERGDVEGDDDE